MIHIYSEQFCVIKTMTYKRINMRLLRPVCKCDKVYAKPKQMSLFNHIGSAHVLLATILTKALDSKTIYLDNPPIIDKTLIYS
jgi:hypothetical protein